MTAQTLCIMQKLIWIIVFSFWFVRCAFHFSVCCVIDKYQIWWNRTHLKVGIPMISMNITMAVFMWVMFCGYFYTHMYSVANFLWVTIRQLLFSLLAFTGYIGSSTMYHDIVTSKWPTITSYVCMLILALTMLFAQSQSLNFIMQIGQMLWQFFFVQVNNCLRYLFI